MVNKRLKIVIDNVAKKSLKEAYLYIKERIFSKRTKSKQCNT